MRYAFIADIHGNLAALQAVLEDIDIKGGVDEIWCLGDIVGYGPQPRECIELVKKHCSLCVAGNHDLAVAGKLELSWFNPAAAEAAQWTMGVLNPVDVRYLEDLPLRLEKDDFTIVHGSPSDPVLEYIISVGIAEKNFAHFKSKFCVVGHSHIPAAYKEEPGAADSIHLMEGVGLVLHTHRMIVNPGAVGQPRDGDPRASWALYESEGLMLRLHRVEYDIKATQDKMMEARLPVMLVSRLEQGR
ncbi:MAG TPA: metallophosphoesterase family protein [Dehalococcoidales bacterium]|nr:metallophosphoesterase family protein [Dehalococcoidales bacterium]